MPKQALAHVPDDTLWFWQEHAACREVDPQLFFHPQNERGVARQRRERAAKSICAHCSVRAECADYALRAHEPYGIWGGLSEEDRAALGARFLPRTSAVRSGSSVPR